MTPGSTLSLPSPDSSLARDRAAEAEMQEQEAFRVLSSDADGRTGRIPHGLLAAHAIRVTAGGDFPVQSAALEALLRRLKNGRDAGLQIRSGPRGGAPLGLFRVGSGDSATTYRVLLGSMDPPSGSCECPDYLRSALGLCKHLLWLLDDAFGSKSLRRAPPSPLPPPPLTWDPVRPLTGTGDWLERVAWRAAASSATGALSLQRAALGRWFTAGRDPRPLARAFADAPRRRLALVQDLLGWIRGVRGRAPAADPALVALLEKEQARLSASLPGAWTPRELERHLGSLERKLFPYQEEGVRRFLAAERLLLADDMGLGKTAQAIAACHVLHGSKRARKGLIVVPAALKPQWLREWRAFSKAPVAVVDGPPRERARTYRATKEGFLIVNYEQVLKDLPELLRFGADIVVLDEAQRIKNWATKTATFVKRLQPRYRLVLTGTPLENRLDELASLMDWVDDLALEPKWRLAPWHCLFADGSREVVGARNLDTVRARLEGSTLRRVRKDVLRQLPPRTDTRVPVLLTAEQKGAHDELSQPIAALMQRASRRPLTQAEFLKLMSLLTQQRIICNGLAQLDFEETWPVIERAGRPTEALLKGLFSPKLIELRELLSQLVLTQQRKVVIFSQWRRMLRLAEWATSDLLTDAGVRAVYFTGEEGQRRRTQNLVDFHDDPRTCVLFATDAGGVGLNLQRAASACIHLDLPWNPAVLEQRTGRILRLGQSRPVDVYYLAAATGIEARIASLVGDKKALFDGLFDGGHDEVRFERSGSFLATIQRLMEPVVVPDLVGQAQEEDGPGVADPEVKDDAPPPRPARLALAEVPPPPLPGDPPPATGRTDAPAPATVRLDPVNVQSLFAQLRVEQTSDGRLVLEASKEAAGALAALFQGMAGLLGGAPSRH
jgi:superfamily II DNA or RNA helicase